MAEFQKVMRELRRLCEGRKCTNCPIWGKYDVSTTEVYCSQWIRDHFEEAEHIIMKWAAENPIKTNGMKFREVFGIDMMAMLTGEHAPLDDWLDAEYEGGQDEQN